MYTSSDVTVHSNGQMVKVYISKNNVTANAWATISTGIVPSGYRPHTNIRVLRHSASSNNTDTMFLDREGKINTIPAISKQPVDNVFYYAKY